MGKIIVLILFLFYGSCIKAQEIARLSSPDGDIVFTILLKKDKPVYSVSYKKQLLIDNSAINFIFKDGKKFDTCSLIKPPYYISGHEMYDLIVGKTSSITHSFNGGAIHLKAGDETVSIQEIGRAHV